MTQIKDTKYYITPDFKIYNIKLKRNIAINLDTYGYPIVKLFRKTRTLHRVIAETLIPNPNNYETIDHIDGDKRNNNPNNLEWVTREENYRRSVKMGLQNKSRKLIQKANERRKLFTNKQILEIRNCDNPYGLMAKKYNVSRGVIWQIINQKTYKEVAPNEAR